MSSIKKFYCQAYNPHTRSTLNFGDCINRVFFDLLTGETFDYSDSHSTIHYHSTGSVLRLVNENSIVYGTGFLSKSDDLGAPKGSKITNKVYKVPKIIISVRGPLTRQKLLNMGIKCPDIYGDPLMLFPLIYNNDKISEIKGKVGIIPHYHDQNNINVHNLTNNLKKTNQVEFINVCTGLDYKRFIDKILSCEYIISSSLHGMMMGIAYKKKSVLVEFSNNVYGNLFKFNDFFGSIDVSYKVKNVYDTTLLDNCIPYDLSKIKTLVETMIKVAPFIIDKQPLLDKCVFFT